MARRIEVELTSTRDDGNWTWRAANARQPKGEVNGSLLYPDAKIGDVIKVEAEFHLDGIEVIEVFPPKAKKERSDLLQLVSRPLADDELVTTVRTGRRDRDDDRRSGGGRKRRDGDRGPRRDGGGRGDGGRGDGGRGPGGRGEGGERGQRRDGGGRGNRGPREDNRPKAKRLRPGRVHRNAALEAVPEEHRPIAEQVLKGGLPAVRAAIEKQNTEAAAAGAPTIELKPVLAIAEPMVTTMKNAEWHDRADAALADLDELELRDLRSVVSAADPTSKDETARAKAEQLRTGLNARLEKDQAAWLAELESAVQGGRTIRALRLSSRPVKAGAPIPAELATKLTEAAAAALSADIASDRWAAVVDALAYSPVRGGVTPVGYPAEPTPELLEAVKRIADRIPAIANQLGIDPSEAASKKRRRPKREANKKKPASKPAEAPAPSEAAPAAETPAPETAPVAETPAPETAPVAETPAPETAPVAETPAPETAPVAETPAPETAPAEAPAADAAPAAEESAGED